MTENFTELEITSQLDTWQASVDVLKAQQDQITDFFKQGKYEHVVFTGCGSTHYLARTAAHYFQSSTGIPSTAAPASELLLRPASVYSEDKATALVTISRSAATTETIYAARAFRQRFGNHVLTISCYDDRPLNEESALNVSNSAGQEKSVAQTRSFSSMLVMAEGLAQIVSDQSTNLDFSHLPENFMAQSRQIAADYVSLEKYDRYFYLGGGALYGLAAEAMLKMKEMALTYAEAYHPMEFRHGPMSMVDDRTVIIGLLDEVHLKTEAAVLEDMKQLGATVISIGYNESASFSLPDPQSLVQVMPVLQWLAFLRAEAKGLNPDQPRHLNQVIELADTLSNYVEPE